eukprot:GHVH01001343.1.p1 GENE.GHVH01001343.1~~GHVH01001343.1.p1  ORF type:complete len:118 (+),score=11.48 GHVH01001343.1:33-386(+)
MQSHTTQEAQEKRVRGILNDNGIHMSRKPKDCQSGRSIKFLGAVIGEGRITLSNEKINDYIMTQHKPAVRAGNHAYFVDRFGCRIDEDPIRRADLRGLNYCYKNEDKVFFDGQKGDC